MGHTVLPFTWQYRNEKAYFASFRRALLLAEDKGTFDDLWNRAEFHLPAAEMASHTLPFATILSSQRSPAIDLHQAPSSNPAGSRLPWRPGDVN